MSKSCQEKIAAKPQNVRCAVSNESTCSGRLADAYYGAFSAFLHSRRFRVASAMLHPTLVHIQQAFSADAKYLFATRELFFFPRCLSLMREKRVDPRRGILARWALSIPRTEGQLTPAPVRASVCEGMLEKIAALGAVADVMAGAKQNRRAHASYFAANGCSLLSRRAAALYEIWLAQSANFYSTLVLSSKPDFAHSTRHSVTSRNALKSFCCSKNAQATRHLNATLPNCGFCLIFQHSSQSFEPDPQVKAP